MIIPILSQNLQIFFVKRNKRGQPLSHMLKKQKRENTKWKGNHETNHRTGSQFLFSLNSIYDMDMSWWAWIFLCFIPTFYICSSRLTVLPSLCSANVTVKVISRWYKSKCPFSLEGNTETEETVCNWVVAKTYSFQKYLPYIWKWLYHNFVFGAFLYFKIHKLCSSFFILVNVVC